MMSKLDLDSGCVQSSGKKVYCRVRARLPNKYGTFQLLLYETNYDKEEHLALVYGNKVYSQSLDKNAESQDGLDPQDAIFARIHSSCFTSEVLGSLRCDCNDQLEDAMKIISNEGHGVIIYLKQEGRGIGLREKLSAYNLIDKGYDTLTANLALNHDPDMRSYDIAVYILNDLNLHKIKLLTNNPNKTQSLLSAGFSVEQIPMIPRKWRKKKPNILEEVCMLDTDEDASYNFEEVDAYLISKVEKMGHNLNIPKKILKNESSSKLRVKFEAASQV